MIQSYQIETTKGKEFQRGVRIGEWLAIAPVFYESTLATGYCVTHIPSGRYVFGFKNRNSALKFCHLTSSFAWGNLDYVQAHFPLLVEVANTCL
jgi:hypothetical protein